MERKIFASGSPWEDVVGYSRAVRTGNIIEVSGTTSVDGEKVIGEGSYFEQTRYILLKIRKVIEDAGGNIGNVSRTRIYVRDISKWEEVARAHAELFRTTKPATSMVEVSRLIDDRLLVEIEATAIAGT